MYSEFESDFDYDGALSEPGPRVMTEAEMLDLERYADYKCSYRHSVIDPSLHEREALSAIRDAEAQKALNFDAWLDAQPDEEIEIDLDPERHMTGCVCADCSGAELVAFN